MLKKILSTIFTLALFSLNSYGQSPEGFNYQCIVRDNSGHSLTNQTISVRFNILQGSITGSSVYSETHTTNTNGYGLVTLLIGSGTTTDDLALIDWSSGPYYIKVEVDPNAGTNYDDVSTTQMMSVPYALHSKTAEDVINDQVDDADNDPANEYNTGATLNGTNLEITDGGGTQTADLSSLTGTDSQDLTGANLNGTNLTIDIQNGTSTTVDLSPIQDDNDWTTGSGVIYNTTDNVGIGTALPIAELHLNGGRILFSLDDATYNSYINLNNTSHNLRIQTTGNAFASFNGNRSVGLGLQSGDYVGFGTNSPGAKLHIQQDGSSISDGIKFTSFVTAGQDWYQYMNGADDLIFRDDGSDVMVLQNSTGNVGIGTIAPITPLDVEGTVRTGWKGYSDRIHVMPSDLRASTGTGNWSMNTGSSGSSRGNTIRVYGGTDAYASIMIPQGYYVSGYKVDFDANPCDMVDVYENSTASNIPMLRSSINPNGFTSFIESFTTGNIIEGGNGTYVTIHFENVGSNEFTLEGMVLYISKCLTGDCGL
ncbi:MAG: hypothetical protein P8M12_05435 [Flavobacteriales bacterium]|jgi:hypothetical protein|nr:hypothetical protein [Flavobacteriales bacterium]